MEYSVQTLDHFQNPFNVGSFPRDDPRVGTGMGGSPAQRAVIKLQILIDAHGVIEDARFQVYGCVASIAAGSLITEWAKGKTLVQAAKVRHDDIVEALALPPLKIHCAVLAERVLRSAIDDYKSKQSELGAAQLSL